MFENLLFVCNDMNKSIYDAFIILGLFFSDKTISI